MTLTIQPVTLQFKQPAGTSRGVYTTRRLWYILVDGQIVGECAPLPALSCDDLSDYEERLCAFAREVETLTRAAGRSRSEGLVIPTEELRPYPSMLFGFETASWHLQTEGFRRGLDTPFARGERGITFNGLIWMGTYEQMRSRIEEKLAKGFRCVKLKIGAINFDDELALLTRIRRDYGPDQIELRVDANGGFTPEEAPTRLRQLAALQLHSIEQPIRARQWPALAELCATSPLPIALDEELIGINTRAEKEQLLDTLRPQYIVLKPSLHGGISGTWEWIELARARGIGYWLTSALESNVGLTAIAHLCACIAERYPDDPALPQGLGTGQLFSSNQPSSLELRGDEMWWQPQMTLEEFLDEWHASSPCIEVQTSGSTGSPKRMQVEKSRMLASARITCDFLGLKPGQTALLCMPLRYIAGKMMVVRSLERDLQLQVVAPSSHPLSGLTEAPDFVAMVPMQVSKSLEVPAEAALLRQVKQLIIGGGAIDERLLQQLQDFPHAVWSTYGMTETLSHIALRRLNGPEATSWYSPFEGVRVWLTDVGTLAIHAPAVCAETLETNDLAEINELGQFRILGRRDNTICSGGVKIQIEEAERLINVSLPTSLHDRCRISWRPDSLLGQSAVLLVESSLTAEELAQVRAAAQALPRYWRPKQEVRVASLPLTGTGKPDRAKLHLLACQ